MVRAAVFTVETPLALGDARARFSEIVEKVVNGDGRMIEMRGAA